MRGPVATPAFLLGNSCTAEGHTSCTQRRHGFPEAARVVALADLCAALGAALALVGCSPAAAPQPAGPPTPTSASAPTTPKASPTTEVTANAQTECDLVCERARIVPRPADGPDYNEKATANANTVLESMHDDLLGCYKKRVAVNPNAHGFITIDIIVDPDGKVRNVETTRRRGPRRNDDVVPRPAREARVVRPSPQRRHASHPRSLQPAARRTGRGDVLDRTEGELRCRPPRPPARAWSATT